MMLEDTNRLPYVREFTVDWNEEMRCSSVEGLARVHHNLKGSKAVDDVRAKVRTALESPSGLTVPRTAAISDSDDHRALGDDHRARGDESFYRPGWTHP